MSAVHVITVAK